MKTIHAHGDKKIVITIAPQPLDDCYPEVYHWYIYDLQGEILSDNTHDYGCESQEEAIAIAKNLINNFTD